MNLMKLEMMNATERVAEALQTRGLFIKVENDFIILTTENTTSDMKKVRELLNQLSVPTFWKEENIFQVLLNKIPISVMKRIINEKGHSFSVHMEEQHFYWRAFVQRRFGIKVNALDLDANIALFVKSLNLSGITALAGCNGHHRYSPNIQLSGCYQGAWFEIIQDKYLSELPLHYQWRVHYNNRSGSCIVAEKGMETKWNMNLIYQDTVMMAEVLQRYATEIRELKQHSFKRNKKINKQAKELLDKQDYSLLKNWMKSLVLIGSN